MQGYAFRFRVLIAIIFVLQTLLWLGDRPDIVAAQEGTVSAFATVSAASYEKAVAPDSIVAGFGTSLTTVTQSATTIPLPNVLGNITVEVNGRPAFLLFISPAQINYLLPEDLIEGTGQVVVKRDGLIVAAGEIEIRAGAPSIFMANSDVLGPPAANLIRVRANGSQVLESAARFDGATGRFLPRVIDLDAPNEAVFLILYLTGTSKEPRESDYRVLLGGSECGSEYMAYVGPAPGFAGLKQINLNLSGCVQGLREKNERANFTGIVSIILSDIKNRQTSNIFELEFAPPTGGSPRIDGLNKATLLAGEMLEIQGSGLAETTEVYMTDSNGKRFNAQIEPPISQSSVKVRVPFGAGSGTITAVTARGGSTFPFQMRTSVSGVVQVAEQQPDGSYKRRGIRNVSVRLTTQNAPPAVMTNDDGSFQIADVTIAGGAGTATALLSVDAAPAGLPNIKRTEKMPIFINRDNEFPGYLEMKAATGPSVPTGPEGALLNELVRVPASAHTRENNYTGQTGEVVFDPNGSTVRFPDGSTVSSLRVTVLDIERTPADLPPGQFSSTIVQLTPFGASITPGGKLTFPNTDGLPAGTTATLYRFDQTPGSATLGQFVSAGAATVSADGQRIETGPRAIIESTYYFVSVPRPVTAVYGSVMEADGQPARAAKVQVRGQSGFALTDVSGGFFLRNVPVVGVEMVIEVSYLRADGTVDRTERRGVVPQVGVTNISPGIVLPDEAQARAPVILLPQTLKVEAGKTIDYTFLAYTRLATATLQTPVVTGAPFASILSLGSDRYVLRLAPGTAAAGNYILTVTATDNLGGRTERTIAVEVTAPVVNMPTAASQSVTTDEDQMAPIVLSGSGGNIFRVVNAPRRGVLTGTLPNLVYTPNRDFNGTDDFNFTVGNGSVESAPAKVTIAVRPVADRPRLEVGTSFRTNIGQLLRVVINGFDADAEQTLVLANSPLPAGAKIERVTATSWLLSWMPTSQQIGSFNIDLALGDDATPRLVDIRRVTIVVDAAWTRTSGPEGGAVNDFVVSGKAILAGLGASGGVYRTIDNGATWSDASRGIEGAGVNALAASGTTLFAGTSGSGVYRSIDSGATWAQLNTGLPTTLTVNAFVVRGKTVFAGTAGSGVYRTTDDGANWVPVNNGLTNLRVSALTLVGTTLFAGLSENGVFRSTDDGANWVQANNGLAHQQVRGFQAIGTTIFVGTFDGGVYRTTDNGNNWMQVINGLTDNNVRDLATIGTVGSPGTELEFAL